MKKFMLIFLFCLASQIFAQTSRNTTLIGNLEYGSDRRGPFGSANDVWGYTDDQGNDYAIVGHYTGVSIAKVASTGLEEVAFVQGALSSWRDIKTHDHYAYVTADERNDGLTIIDLGGLPDSVRLVGTDTTAFKRAHNLYITDGFAYISGPDRIRGVDILDLSDPESPIKVGEWPSPYFHDVYVRNDTLFGSAFNSGSLVILDVGDKSAPVQITEILPGPNVHNAWTTEDGKYVMTTQERTGLTVKMWDIRDPFNAEIVDEYLAAPSLLAHNTHILGDYAYISHYGDGLRIVDISDPTNLVEVGHYDTFTSNQGGFEGNWGAFPFTSSGYIYATDEDFGLFVVSFNGRRAARLSGQVLDAKTGQPVSDVTIEVKELEQSTTSDAEGNYKLGFSDPGLFTILAYRASYDTTKFTFNAEEGESKTFDVMMNSATSIDQEKSVIPASYSIEQNYPNPFNPNTIIRYSLPEKTHVRLKVFDTLGREVRVLFDGEQLRGEQQTSWNGRDNSGRLVASGVYFYRIETDAFRKTTKMLFIE